MTYNEELVTRNSPQMMSVDIHMILMGIFELHLFCFVFRGEFPRSQILLVAAERMKISFRSSFNGTEKNI